MTITEQKSLNEIISLATPDDMFRHDNTTRSAYERGFEQMRAIARNAIKTVLENT